MGGMKLLCLFVCFLMFSKLHLQGRLLIYLLKFIGTAKRDGIASQ